jgi:hypothetical protein
MSFVVAFAAGGCSGKDHGPGAPENPAGGGVSTGEGSNRPAAGTGGSPTGGSATGGSAVAGVPDAVNRILTLAHEGVDGTYTATYRVRLPGGRNATARLAQDPPKFGFHVDQGKQRNVVVYDGKAMSGCLTSGKGWRCTQVSAPDDPTEVAETYPPAVLHLLDGLVRGAGREVELGTTTRTVEGAKVDCATFTSTIENPPPPQVLCVRKDGVLAYASTVTGQVLELTGFKPAVDANYLAVPR